MDTHVGAPPPRLTPTMSSRKALVLNFVTAWIGDHPGSSPSLSEIGRGAGISKERAAALVRQLVSDGRILRRPGMTRGLMLPDELERALKILRGAGLAVSAGPDLDGVPPPLTFATLPMLPFKA